MERRHLLVGVAVFTGVGWLVGWVVAVWRGRVEREPDRQWAYYLESDKDV